MKRLLVAGSSALLMVSLVAGSVVAAPNVKFKTFGSAQVIPGPAGTFTIVSDDASEYGGVYLASRSTSGKRIGRVKLSFTSTRDVTGGAPRFSIPINTDGVTNKVAFYAFLDVNGCGGASGGTTVVSTTRANCTVYAGSETFANWAAFAAAHPTYRIAPGKVPFIIADGSLGTFKVSNIVLR